MLNDIVPLFAEVMNMKRSIVITGPTIYPRTEGVPWDGGQGITTRQNMGGVMDLRFIKIENCGRIVRG